MRILLATVALLVALPGAAYAADVLINNGDDCSNPANVIDGDTYLNDTVHVRNVGCGTPDPGSPCAAPGDPTEVCVVWGAVVDHVYGYDSSAVTMSGGTVDYLYAHDSSNVTMNGGEVLTMLYASNSSTVTMSGGTGDFLIADISSTVTMSGGTVDYLIATVSSTVTINGGEVLIVVAAHDSSTVTMSGGAVDDSLYAYDDSIIRIVGSGFAVDGSPVPYGDLTAQTGTLTGTLASGDPINNVFYQGGGLYTGTITLAPPLPALPKWGYVALAGGLIVVGAVVMWRRAA